MNILKELRKSDTEIIFSGSYKYTSYIVLKKQLFKPYLFLGAVYFKFWQVTSRNTLRENWIPSVFVSGLG